MGGCFQASGKKYETESQADKRRRSKRDPTQGNLIVKSKISSSTILENIRDYYEFVKVIGYGHFGTVRLVIKKADQNKFAVKSIPKEKVASELHLLKRELEVLYVVDHPNIVKFYETYEDDLYFHIVMEYCSGGDLYNLIDKRGSLSEEKAGIIMQKLLSAIQHLHEKQIVHRDLKPENFLFSTKDPNSEIKIIDFGLANKFQGKKTLSTIVGTPYYVAPEVLQGKYQHQCDL